ncbi:DUF1501 domain-containing protein [Verrucomicrobia bacterium]|nr:DUF1501 domain-containing protein [Verrucomicrobiota bacterium]MDC0268021.1 DUF1501 domain-containing protein [bacterium]
MSGKQTCSRREWLEWSSHGLAGAALGSLFAADRPAMASPLSPHHPAQAKRVIHICLMGGLSHVDSFDYKPELGRFHGKPLQYTERPATFFNRIGLLRKNDWAFRQHGQSGLWISDLFPHIAGMADELTVIRSMVADSANHTPATFQQNTGFQLNGFPVMGSWISYGLGHETEDLPTYVVLPDARGYPAGGTINWSNGFLPSTHQGVAFDSGDTPIPDLFPPSSISKETDLASRNLLKTLNQQDLKRHGLEDVVQARIRSHELAARMQLSIPEITDLSHETSATREMYGLHQETSKDFGKNCLLGRRLLERGVRFVQLISGGSFGSPRINWDGHEDMPKNHAREAERVDQPVAALLKDLKQRGMLEDTLVLFTTEFGRTPYTQADANKLGSGRDHNMYGFSLWMAGAGLRPGLAYGQTDEIGWKASEDPVHWHDFHATLLQRLGMDHTKLSFYHNGIERRLTNVHGEIIQKILA